MFEHFGKDGYAIPVGPTREAAFTSLFFYQGYVYVGTKGNQWREEKPPSPPPGAQAASPPEKSMTDRLWEMFSNTGSL